MAKKTRFQEILAEYSNKYDLETLNSPNDRANLEMLINNQVVVEPDMRVWDVLETNKKINEYKNNM